MKQSEMARERMSSVDRAWLGMDHPTNLMMINGLLFFDRSLSREEVQPVLEERLLVVSRFSHRVTAATGRSGHEWESVSPDMSYHLVEHELDAPGDDRHLQDLVSGWMSTSLDRSKPLWRLHLVHGYQQGAVLLWRLHHCIGDGLALMLVLLSLTEPSPDGQPSMDSNPLRRFFGPEPLSPETAKGILQEVMPAAAKILTAPAEQLGTLSWWKKGGASVPALSRLVLRPPDSKTLFKGELGAEKSAVWSDSIPLSDVNRIRGALGGTVNDILTNAVAGGLRRYLESRGGLRNRLNIRAVVPVSLRPVEGMASLGNQFGLVFLSLPVGIADPRERLAELGRRMNRLKRSFEPVVALKLLGLIGSLPPTLRELAIRNFGAKATAVLTNVPGPLKTMYFAGKPIRSFLFWVPGRFGIGISIGSYDGQVRVGIATDTGLVPDPEAIVAGFHQEFSAMLRLAATQEV